MKAELQESSGVGTVCENSSFSVPVSKNIHLLISIPPEGQIIPQYSVMNK